MAHHANNGIKQQQKKGQKEHACYEMKESVFNATTLVLAT